MQCIHSEVQRDSIGIGYRSVKLAPEDLQSSLDLLHRLVVLLAFGVLLVGAAGLVMLKGTLEQLDCFVLVVPSSCHDFLDGLVDVDHSLGPRVDGLDELCGRVGKRLPGNLVLAEVLDGVYAVFAAGFEQVC